MGDRAEIQEIKQLLCDRLEDVCRWLLPDGRRTGRTWNSINPKLDGPNKTPELHVYFTGAVGSWKDFRSGDKSDILGLIEYLHDTDFKGALALAKDFLGLQRMSADDRRRNQARAVQEREKKDEAAKRREDAKRRDAEQLFLSGAAWGSGTPAEIHARRFDMETRRIDLDAIQHLDTSTFRYLPDCEYWTLADWQRDPAKGRFLKVKEGPRFPAIVSAMRWINGQFADHHVTFLDPVTPDKARLPATKNGKPRSPRLMRCPNKGAVMRISHGPEGKPPELSTEPQPLILAEGRETALSLAEAIPQARVWACGSINGIAAAPVNFPFVSLVIVAGENDWEKPEAQRQLQSALQTLEETGKPLELMLSHVGSDFNDLR
ncbi:MAG: toprim domain-containing protein [Roseibium sp.]|uniref:toprim domain-containing protein n=1 Tax=Roseibium sp. TaxID=1936156 RepID=UPI001B048DC9|nr:toprim domain-containing protein [Roseibium sp.]MBO6893410.1 toprim domain-containing protein [Roseibium sp.]MBO6930623.1 toprim domain-containing protein [Roseibium sp.]